MKKGWVDAHRPTLLHPKKSWAKYLALKGTVLAAKGVGKLAVASYQALTPEQLPNARVEDTQALWRAVSETDPIDLEALAADLVPAPYRAILIELLRPELTPPILPDYADAITQARWRDAARRFLTLYHYGSPRQLAAPFLKVIERISSYLPPPSKSQFSIPISDFLPNIPQLIEDTILEFYKTEDFASLKETLDRNATDEKDNLILPTKSKAADIPKHYLKDTPLLKLFDASVPFEIPRKSFASHGIILAPPNHGKTQLLGSLVSRFLNDVDPVGIILLDPHGDLFTNLRTRVPPERRIVLDPDTNPPPLNFLDFGSSTEAQTLQTFSYLMSSLSGGLSDKQGAIVPYLLKLLRKIPDASLETLRLIVDEKVKGIQNSQFRNYIATLPVVDQGFFHNQFYSPRMQETKDAIGWKLYAALSSDAFRQMFSARTNSFDADAAMRDRKVVLVKGARQSLGDAGMQVFLQFVVAQFFSAALRREKLPMENRQLCILFADEAHHIFNSQTANILTECRKYGLGFLAATQVVQQIPDDVKAAIYGATAIKIAGPVSHTDASILAREMHTTADFIRSMGSTESSHAEWACYVSNTTKKAVRMTVPFGAVEKLPTYEQPPPTPKTEAPKPQPPQSPPAPPPRTPIIPR